MDSVVRGMSFSYVTNFHNIYVFIAQLITSLAISSGPLFALNCTSSGSPATYVMWRKDGVILSESTTYRMSQIFYSGTASTYFSLLEVTAGPYAVTGDYSCEVSNSGGNATRNVTFRGKFSDISNHYTGSAVT